MATWSVRPAGASDVEGLCRFGAEVVPEHYAPLLGAPAAEDQVRVWWNPTHLGAAVRDGLVVVAEADGQVVGVGQRGTWDGEHVIWKLYLDRRFRNLGLGPTLLDALLAQLPPTAERVFIEHFGGNERAGRFYERLGFRVDRVDRSAGDERVLDTVWRVRDLHGDPSAPTSV